MAPRSTLGPSGRNDPIHDGVILSAEARAAEPVFQRFRRVGWIALWHPVDMLFFERLPLLREQRVLRRIQNADVRVL